MKFINKLLIAALLGLISTIIIWLLAHYVAKDLLYSYEARTYDWRIKSKIQDVPEAAIESIVIVDIDGLSVSELGKFSQWPRNYYPQLIENLNQGGAKAIGLDIIFDKTIWNPHYDREFVAEVDSANNVFNALYFAKSDSDNFRYSMPAEPAGFNFEKFKVNFPGQKPDIRREERFESEFVDLLNASIGVGHVNFNADNDGVVRSIHLFTQFNQRLYPSLAFSMYMHQKDIDSLSFSNNNLIECYSTGNLVSSIPVDDKGNMMINYYGSYKTFRYVSFYHILEKQLPSEYYNDKIFLVGTSLAGLFDLRSTPMLQAFPGVEIHANILHTLLNEDFVTKPSAMTNFLIVLGFAILLSILLIILGPLWSAIALLVLATAHVFISSFIFIDSNIWIEIVNPVLAGILTFSLVFVYRFATEERKKRFIRNTFSHFVTKSVVDELLANPEKIKLGGEKKICTVLFSDVAGFTTIAERLSPEALVSLLNDYLTQMTNIIFKYNGMLDKYEGDAIMAVFGAPVSSGNDAYNACASAVEMQDTLTRMRSLWRKQGRAELSARIGVNTGPMVVGNMGSETRFDYTVMGDAVNLGARLEPANKEYGTGILIGEETFNQTEGKIIARQLDLLKVKGKTAPVKVFELISTTEKGIDDKARELLNLFDQGFDAYLKQNWMWAINYFEQALVINPNDGPSKRLLKRCKIFQENPPGKDWDGVFTMRYK